MDDKKKPINEDLSSMSIEDIMADGFSREIATAIYEAEHHINMCEPVEAHEYLARLRKMRDELNRK